MVYTIDWQLTINGRMLKGGSELAVVGCHLLDGFYSLALIDDANQLAEFVVYANVNIGGKNYLLVFSHQNLISQCATSNSVQRDATLIMLRLLDKKRVCAMDPDRFSSLRNAVNTCLESGETTSLSALQSLLVENYI